MRFRQIFQSGKPGRLVMPVALPVFVFFSTLSACAQTQQTTWQVKAPRADAASGGSGVVHRPHAGMLRFPDVSATHIAFGYANDLWLVPRAGGLASPLAGPPGQELFPRFNQDGQRIAFVGNYEGNSDLYVIDVGGGVATRVTHHPAREIVTDWTPDGRLLFFANGLAGLRRQTQLFTVSANGGLPEKLPVPYGALGAISADGEWLAYTPHTRDHRTWKRYKGGMATDIWLFNLKDHSSKRITDWDGTDSLPMWHNAVVYYLSDAGSNHRLNIWSYDVESGKRKQITHFAEFDVKWPAVGPGANGSGEIVLQNGPSLYLVDLATNETQEVAIAIPGDRPMIRPQTVDAAENITSGSISSTGQRAVVEARGDIWTVPAKHGGARNLTRTPGVAERDPAWSPDGQWVAYFSDSTGEYELFIAQSDGKGETRQLTKGSSTYFSDPTWSPNSEHLVYGDKTGAIHLHTIASGETKTIDTEQYGSPGRVSWSHDSGWLAYTKGGDNQMSAVWLYHLDDSNKHQVTSGMFEDGWPTFDREGDYLFLTSHRQFDSPIYEDLGSTFVYAGTDLVLAVPLRDDVKSPWAPKSDEEEWDSEDSDDEDDDESKKDDKGDKSDSDNGDGDGKGSDDESKESDDDSKDEDGDSDEDKDKDKKKEEIEPLEIDLDGFESRAIALPIDKGMFSQLAVNHEGKLLYVRRTPRGVKGEPAIHIFDLTDEEKKEKTVIEDVRAFAMSADGKKILAWKGPKKAAIVEAAADQKFDKPLSFAGMNATFEPKVEWRQLFVETWRIQRDYFYDPNMHGVDWNAVRARYAPMIEDCASREDVTYVLGEVVAELNVGHAYIRGGGDRDRGPKVSVGMLGADFELDNGAYRISRIVQGAAWDVDARGPLSQPGVDVKVGDYLLAINGVPLDTSRDPWAALQGLAGKVVTITVGDKPTPSEEDRDEVVELLKNENTLRFRAWIEHNRKYVEDKTDGKVGYVYVPDTGVNGQNELFRQFYGQRDKQALIIDERWNGGGQIPTRFIELLNRPRTNYWAVRDGKDWAWPPDSLQGPKCMLINGLAGSGGDCFPYYFRQAGLGKLIGMRTWGGLVGISGNPRLIDGGGVTSPTFAFYETDGTWGVEGYGVAPDIEVIDDPAKMVDGGDPQLDTAIEHMLGEIKRIPYRRPARPAYPDRSGMGVLDKDR